MSGPPLPPVPLGLRSPSPNPKPFHVSHSAQPYGSAPFHTNSHPSTSNPYGPPVPPPPPPADYLRHAAEQQKKDYYGAPYRPASAAAGYGPGSGMLAPQPRREFNTSEAGAGPGFGQGGEVIQAWEDRRPVSAQSQIPSGVPPPIGMGYMSPTYSNSGGPPAMMQSHNSQQNPMYQQQNMSTSPPPIPSLNVSMAAAVPPAGFAINPNAYNNVQQQQPATPTASNVYPSNLQPQQNPVSQRPQSDYFTQTSQPSNTVQRPPRIASMILEGGGGSTVSSATVTPSPTPGPKDGEIAITLPSIEDLSSQRDLALRSGAEESKINWARDVLKFIERFQTSAALTSPDSPEAGRITDPQLVRWTDESLKIILASNLPAALYLKGELSSTGSFPSYRAKDLKLAFREFEGAANRGWPRAWFRIGREYETFGDTGRAVMAFENGRKKGDCGCIYRLGMAYLLGQLGRNPDLGRAVRLLKQSADISDLDFPQPAYIYGMLLAGEFEHVSIPPTVLQQDINLARQYIAKSAYYRYPAAEYKMGFSAEYALLGVPFDPLLSVQYYSLASQAGEVEADMALSKWFLCGAEGSFAVNEDLAFTFAEKAARKGLPTAEFAVGYYFEVGIGCTKDISAARKWYDLASTHGNEDAKQRVQALSRDEGNALSRNEHQSLAQDKLVRKRTQAQQRSENANHNQPPMPAISENGGAANHLPQRGDSIGHRPGASGIGRRETMRQVEGLARLAKQSNAQGPPPSNGPQRPRPGQYASTGSVPRPQPQYSNDGQGARVQHQASYPVPGADGGRVQSPPSPTKPPPPKGPETFAEMGITTGKAKGDDCVVM